MSLNLDRSTWKRVKLGDVVLRSRIQVDPVDGGVDRYVAGGHVDTESVIIQRSGNVADGQMGSTFRYLFRPGQVLFVSARPYLRKIGVPDFTGVVADKTYVLDSAPGNGLLHDILPFLLTSDRFVEYATQEATGSMNPRLLWGAMQRYEFHLPPLDDQERIADLLWAVERHRLAVNEIANSVDAAADVRLTDLWEQDRDKRAIGDIAEGVTGSTPSKSNKTFWNSEDVPFYTPSEINSDTMLAARQRVSQAGAAVGRLLPKHAVAVACIGGDMGKSAVIAEPGISNQQITSIVGLQKDDAYALQSLLAHALGRAAMEARETTTIVRKLNKSDLMKVQIPWPADRAVLRKLVSDRRAAHWALSTEIASLSALRWFILADIFGGN